MSRFSEYIGSQFGNPRGFVGAVCTLIMNAINKAMYKRTVALINVPKGARILDIGYGNGYLLKLLDKAYQPDMYGIDISEDMQSMEMKKNRPAVQAGRVHLCVGDCCDLPYNDENFAAVTSLNTVYFWKDTAKGLQEIRRCLKQGGCFYNVVYTKEWLDKLSYTKMGFKKFEAGQLKQLGSEAGFAEIEVQEIVQGKSFVVICKK